MSEEVLITVPKPYLDELEEKTDTSIWELGEAVEMAIGELKRTSSIHEDYEVEIDFVELKQAIADHFGVKLANLTFCWKERRESDR